METFDYNPVIRPPIRVSNPLGWDGDENRADNGKELIAVSNPLG